MSRLEKFNESEFRKDVLRLGGEALKQRADINAGIPDRLVWLPTPNGIIWFWVEWKRYGKPPMPHQLAYHKKLRDAGHLVFVFDDNKHARQVMQGLISGE